MSARKVTRKNIQESALHKLSPSPVRIRADRLGSTVQTLYTRLEKVASGRTGFSLSGFLPRGEKVKRDRLKPVLLKLVLPSRTDFSLSAFLSRQEKFNCDRLKPVLLKPVLPSRTDFSLSAFLLRREKVNVERNSTATG
jgi:hypothetical protein